MVLEAETPRYPVRAIEDGYLTMYPFLAHVGINPAAVCVREGTITAISNVNDNYVSVLVDGITYTNVLVLVHTDYGCRSRKLANIEFDTETITPEIYFERGQRLFTFTAGAQVGACNPDYYAAMSYGTAPDTRVSTLIYTNSATEEVSCLAVVGITDAGISVVPGFDDIRTYAARSFTPYVLVKETIGSSTQLFSLFDLTTGAAAQVPNNDFSAFVIAEGLDVDDYDYVCENGVERYPASATLGSGCFVSPENIGWPTPGGFRSESLLTWTEGDGTTLMSVGYQMESSDGGGCSCPDYDPDRESSYHFWECTEHSTDTYTCGSSTRTYSTSFEAVGLCLYDDPPYYSYTATPFCPFTNTVNVHYTEYQYVPSGGMLYKSHSSTAVSNMSGKRNVTWFGSSRVDVLDVAVERESDSAADTTDYQITMKINDTETVFSQSYDSATFRYPLCSDGLVIALDASDTFFFSFTLLLVMSKGYEVYAVDLQHEYTPATGIITDGLIDFVTNRYYTLISENPGETIGVRLSLAFLPYDIRTRNIVE